MLGHYLLVALRNFRRNPLSTAIKLLALSLGLVCFLSAHLIGDYLRQSDRHWANADRIRVVAQYLTPPGADREVEGFMPATPPPAAKYLRADFPELEAVARQAMSTVPTRVGDVQRVYSAIGVDSDFVRIFDLDPIAGDVSRLDAPRTALIEQRMAAELFGEADPVGRTLTIGAGVDVTVVGVFAPIPQPTLLESIRLIVPMATADDIILAQFSQTGAEGEGPRFSELESWGFANFITYVLLPEDGSLTAAALQRRLADFAQRHVPEAAGTARYEVQSLSGLTAAAIDGQIFGGAQGISLVRVLYVLGALVLAVACLDFSNLATAQADKRAKEIGLRRTLGASQRQIAVQTLFETALIAAAALILVLPLTLLTVIPMRGLTGLDMQLPGLLRLDYWLSVLAILGGAVLLAGAYPALVLARIRPVLALRAGRKRTGGMRAALTVAQFAVASFLAITVAIMMAQKSELRRTGLGADDDPRVTISYVAGSEPVNVETLRTELLKHPSIVSVSYGMTPYTRIGGAVGEYAASPDPASPRIAAQGRGVATDYFTTVGVRLLAGREFSLERDTPNGDPMPVVIDEETASLLGFTPQEAVGRTIYQINAPAESGGEEVARAAIVVGVAERRPLEFVTMGGADNYIYSYSPFFALQPTPLIRIAREDVPGALAHIDATWQRLNPDVDMRRMFMDEAFDQSFRMFNMLNSVLSGLSAIAVMIAAMGLFGMASFVVQRRLREIGVRKTLGASTPRVLARLLWDFSEPVLIANLIAWPFAWIASRIYLNLFVTRIDLTPWPFLASLAAALLIAWIAVGVHALRAASVKPAAVLKYE